MPNLVVTSSLTSVEVLFNDYSSPSNMLEGTWSKSHIKRVLLRSNHVNISVNNESEWNVSFDGAVNTYQIDNFNGIVPLSNHHLYTLLKVLL